MFYVQLLSLKKNYLKQGHFKFQEQSNLIDPIFANYSIQFTKQKLTILLIKFTQKKIEIM